MIYEMHGGIKKRYSELQEGGRFQIPQPDQVQQELLLVGVGQGLVVGAAAGSKRDSGAA